MSFKLTNTDNVCQYIRFNEVYDRHLKGLLTNAAKLECLLQIKRLLKADFPNYAPLTAWFIENLNSKNLTLLQEDLLVDTIRYLTTGYRSIPLATYRILLTDDNLVESGSSRYVTVTKQGVDMSKERHQRIQETISQCNQIGNQLINQWTSHEDGFLDILQFFMIISEPKLS